ncbi:hypothetical protein BC831DRAFT_450728 [Entophlyctis helioformis]|nr:hypothetical protein BC831DRAFT_450728 [Entophlyctis helioformis]
MPQPDQSDRIEQLLMEVEMDHATNPWLNAPVADQSLDEIVAQTPSVPAAVPAKRAPSAAATTRTPSTQRAAVDGLAAQVAQAAQAAVAEQEEVSGGSSGLALDAREHSYETLEAAGDTDSAAVPTVLECYADAAHERGLSATERHELELMLESAQSNTTTKAQASISNAKNAHVYAPVATPKLSPQALLNAEQLLESVMASEPASRDAASRSSAVHMQAGADPLTNAIWRQIKTDLAPSLAADAVTSDAATLMSDITQHITPSGGIHGDAIMDRLVVETRRLQWERAAAAAASAASTSETSETSAAQAQANRQAKMARLADSRMRALANRRMATTKRPLTEREQEILKGVYSQIQTSGAADADGILESLLGEVMRMSDGRSINMTAKL